MQLNIITPLHQSTSREYLDRMNDDKVSCMLEAVQNILERSRLTKVIHSELDCS